MISFIQSKPETPDKPKSREELLRQFENDLISLEAMILTIEGFEESLHFHKNMEILPQELYFKIPEYCTYSLTIHYRVKKRALKNLSYHHTVKKHGIPLNVRNHKIHECAPINDDDDSIHIVTFPPEAVPGGPVLRGIYPAKSKFIEDGKTILRCSWTIELIKEGETPGVGGYEA